MAYIIAEPCIGNAKDSACVDACPVDCIHPKKDEAGYAEADQLGCSSTRSSASIAAAVP